MSDNDLKAELERWRRRVGEIERRNLAAERVLAGVDGRVSQVLEDQRAWSLATVGEGKKTAGILAHIRKELDEIAAEPDSLEEWIDVVILAMDGAWRATHCDGSRFANMLLWKMRQNRARTWPKPGTVPADQPVEHVRGEG